MKPFKFLNTLAVFTGLLCSFACDAQVKNCDLPSIEEELKIRYEKDQAIRKELIPAAMEYQRTGKGAFKMIKLVNKQNNIDGSNQKYIEKLFDKCGWMDELSKESHNAIFMIIQHSEIEFISNYIDKVKEKAILGLLAKDDHATMLDRKLMYEGKPQLFGTQTFGSEDGKNLVWPIADVENLTARRDSVSLPSMEFYFELAKKEYDVDMVWDKTLTLEQAKAMKE